MAHCEHCGTRFSPRSEADRYCCQGCEFVAQLIDEQGFERFYELKQDQTLTPVRSRPFERHDFSWVDESIGRCEHEAGGEGRMARLTLGLEGISCVGCVWLIEKLFERQPGSVRAMASPSQGRLTLEWLAGRCEVRGFLEELCRFGYVATPSGGSPSGERERSGLVLRLGLCGAFALNTMGFSLPVYLNMPTDFEFAGLFRLIALISATLSLLVGGGYFIGRAWQAWRAGTIHIDLPIALGLVAAYAGSLVGWMIGRVELIYFDFVSTFVFLMLAGRYVQTAAVERNRRRLMRQQPVPQALDTEAGVRIDRADLAHGTRFRLEPGQALPVSSVLVEGEADFSLEWINGESEPQHRTAGCRLPGGAILLSRQRILLLADEAWQGSLLSKLIAPHEGQRVSPLLERVLRIYLLVVIALGAATMLVWCLRGDWQGGLQAMISILVISCPCALGLAIPLADDLAAAAVERCGLFVRHAGLWSRLHQVRRIIFDKTGTLTLERPLLDAPEAVAGLDEQQALALARLTQGSLHPVSRVLLEALGGRGQELLGRHGLGETREHPGLGVVCGEWSLGRAGWLGEGHGAPSGGQSQVTELRRRGELAASFRVNEALRPDALEVIGTLRRQGLGMMILSGDHPQKVQSLGAALGLASDQVMGGLSPEQKAQQVKQVDRGDTLFLGDGANDSLAFDNAWVTGTPVVDRSLLEAKADFFVLGSGLGFLETLFEVGKKRSRAVRRAFTFAVLYNLAAVAAAATGNMGPVPAAILMPLSSMASILLVVRAFRSKNSLKS